jgi:hypothetical protein
MRHRHLILVPALAIAVAITGCNDTARSDYPDRSEQTRAEADAIRAEGDRRDRVIDRDLQQATTALAFQQQQNADKAKLERERIILERDRRIAPVEEKRRAEELQAKTNTERINRDAEAKVTAASEAEVVRIRADAASEMAKIRSESAARLVEYDNEIRAANDEAQKRIDHVDAGEAKERLAIDTRRAEEQRKAREAHLAVTADTTAKLDQLGKQSQQRLDQQRLGSENGQAKDVHTQEQVRRESAK